MIPKAGYMYIDKHKVSPLVFLVMKIEDKGDRYVFKIKTITGKNNLYSIGCPKINIDEIWSYYYSPISNAELIAKVL